MKIAVTGGAGFIGSHLIPELQEAGHYVASFDLKQGKDMRDPKEVEEMLDDYRPGLVIHLAAQVGRLFGEDDVQKTISDNAGITALLAQNCGRREIGFAYASTSEVYGDNGENLCHEDTGPFALPHNLYGLSKRFGEDICNLYLPPDLLWIWRISMPYGPGLPPGYGRAAIINFLYNSLHDTRIDVHRDSERSWCWIGDTVRGLRMTLEAEPGAYNVGRDDNPTSMRRVAEIACNLTGGSRNLIWEIDPPEMQTVVKRLSTEKLRNLGWEPRVDLEEGMGMTLEWVEQNFG